MHFRSLRSWSTAGLIVTATIVAARAAQDTAPPGDPLIAGFKSTYAASVSDAVELVTGKNGTMRYDMKLMTGTHLVGRAVTSLARPAPTAQATPALSVEHSVEIIDGAKPGDVGVIVMEGTLDIAAMGNLMATAAVERGMAGMVLDGAADSQGLLTGRAAAQPLPVKLAARPTRARRYSPPSAKSAVCTSVRRRPVGRITAKRRSPVQIRARFQNVARLVVSESQSIAYAASRRVPSRFQTRATSPSTPAATSPNVVGSGTGAVCGPKVYVALSTK